MNEIVTTDPQSVVPEMTTQVVVAPTPKIFLCAGCRCSEPCGLARVASQIAYGEDVAYNLLGDVVLDFSGAPSSIKELKSHIARAMRGVSIYAAERIMNKLVILPQPSSYTLATTGHGYAIIFVVGENYATHPVVVDSDRV